MIAKINKLVLDSLVLAAIISMSFPKCQTMFVYQGDLHESFSVTQQQSCCWQHRCTGLEILGGERKFTQLALKAREPQLWEGGGGAFSQEYITENVHLATAKMSMNYCFNRLTHLPTQSINLTFCMVMLI